jgi:hypothetical protein
VYRLEKFWKLSSVIDFCNFVTSVKYQVASSRIKMIFILFYCVTLVSGNILDLTKTVGVEVRGFSYILLKV